jgi:hypothetical protein
MSMSMAAPSFSASRRHAGQSIAFL